MPWQEDGSFIWYVTIVGALGVLNLGYDFGICTTVGPLLEKQQQFEVTNEGVEMFNGFSSLAALAGALVSNFFLDQYGRRSTLIISETIFLIGTIATSAAQNLTTLLVFRCISGFGLGMVVPASAIYISELVSPKRRGRMVSWIEMFSQIGSTLAFIIGWSFSGVNVNIGWRIMMLLAAIIPVVLLVCLFTFMPESPRWLIKNGRQEEAVAVMSEITKDHPDKGAADPVAICAEMKNALEQEEKQLQESSWEALCLPTPMVGYALLVGFGLAAIQQLAAPSAITSYMLFIFQHAGIEHNNAYYYLVSVGLLRIATVYVASRLIDLPLMGRRPLLLLSGIGTTISLATIGIIFALQVTQASTNMLISAVFFYTVFYQIGYGPGLYVVLAEIFPLLIRAKALSIATAIVGLIAAGMSLFFLTICRLISYSGFFFSCAAIGVLGVVFIFLLLPETRGVKLEDVTALFDPARAQQRRVNAGCSNEERTVAADGEGRQLLD